MLGSLHAAFRRGMLESKKGGVTTMRGQLFRFEKGAGEGAPFEGKAPVRREKFIKISKTKGGLKGKVSSLCGKDPYPDELCDCEQGKQPIERYRGKGGMMAHKDPVKREAREGGLGMGLPTRLLRTEKKREESQINQGTDLHYQVLGKSFSYLHGDHRIRKKYVSLLEQELLPRPTKRDGHPINNSPKFGKRKSSGCVQPTKSEVYFQVF